MTVTTSSPGASCVENTFIEHLGLEAVVLEDKDRYQRGYRYGAGTAAAIVRPANAEQVQKAIQLCRTLELEPLPQGAHSGLVGAATPNERGKQVIISLERLNTIDAYSPIDRTITCGAGTLLSAVNEHVANDGLVLPIDLAADPSIGGMVATNTGGAKLIRFGDMRRNLLGIEAVLYNSETTIWSDLRGLRKDNTGFDAKQLFVGTAGHYGIVTAATIELSHLHRQSASALLVPRSLKDAPLINAKIEQALGANLTACEGMSGNAVRLALHHHPSLQNPFLGTDMPDFVLLVEAASTVPSGGGVDSETLLTEAIWPLMDGVDPLLENALVTTSGDFFAIRHSISDGLAREGKVIAFDISTARSHLPELIIKLRQITSEMLPNAQACEFGHVGDGGVHFNLVMPREDTSCVRKFRDQVYRIVAKDFAGSISAEHGIGPHNIEYYERYVPIWKKELADQIKDRLFQ